MRTKQPIGILCAVELECRELVATMRGKKRSKRGNAELVSGTFQGAGLVIACSGAGKANAAHGATVLIETVSPGIIINIGIGGAYPSSGLQVGDVAIATKDVYADEGAMSARGFLDMRAMGIPLVRRGGMRHFNSFAADAALLRRAKRALRIERPRIGFGTFLTVSTVTGTAKRAAELGRGHDAVCESMEGAAVFQVATAYGVPCLELRGISNLVGDRNRKAWRIDEAARTAQAMVAELLPLL